MADGKRWWVATCSKTVSVLALGQLLCGCGSGDATGPALDADESGATASVDVALTTVPPSTQCIRITTTPAGGTSTVNSFTVTAGSSSANMTIGKLLPGSYTVAGDAFNVACTSISGIADWVADPVPATMKSGLTTSITLTFRKSNPLKATANFVNNVIGLAVGNSTTYVATDAGLLTSGWQGTGSSTTFYRRTFAMFDGTVAAGNTITSMAATYSGACVARADGTVWCFGQNAYGELGPGIPLNTFQWTPQQLTAVSNVRQLVAGDSHVCAVTYADTASCWGKNDKGQLGNGNTTNTTTPVALGGPVRSMAAGLNSTYMVRGDGTIAAWGANTYGQLGDGTTTDRLSPTTIPGESPTQSVTAGRWHACSQRVDGSVRCWGSNQSGQLGNGTTTNSPTPVLVTGFSPPPKQVVAGSDHTCAINDAGYPYCWGNNGDGILADQSVANRTSPARVGGSVNGIVGGAIHDIQFTSLGAGPLAWHECGITVDSDLWCWGENNNGQLGDGTTLNPFVPIKPLLQ